MSLFKTVANDVTDGAYMLTNLNNVYLFGGRKGNYGNKDEIMKLECQDTIETCKFVSHGNMQYARNSLNVIPISDDIVSKFC